MIGVTWLLASCGSYSIRAQQKTSGDRQKNGFMTVGMANTVLGIVTIEVSKFNKIQAFLNYAHQCQSLMSEAVINDIYEIN